MSEKVTIQDIIELLVEKHGMTKKEADIFVKGMFELIEEALATEKYVKIKGLGIFKLTEVESRESVNVNTGERIEIQGHTKISFTPDSNMKDLINKPFAHFETVVLNEHTRLEDTEMEFEGEEENVEEVTTEKMEEIPITLSTEEEERMTAGTGTETEKEHIVKETILPQENKCPMTIAEAAIAASEEMVLSEAAVSTEAYEVEKAELTNEKEIRTTWGIVIVILLVLCLAGGICWFVLSGSDKKAAISQTSVAVTPPSTENEPVAIPFQDFVIQEKDTVETTTAKVSKMSLLETAVTSRQMIPVLQQSVTSNVKNKEGIKIGLSDTVEYDITGTKTSYTLREGESLVKVSVKFYGTKKLWPYIVKHNKNIIKNADRVPIGTTLRIPELSPKKTKE